MDGENESGAPGNLAALNGLDFLRAMIAGRMPGPSIAETIGFRLVEVDSGVAVFECDVGPHLLNPLGTVHGGVALTLVDSATGCALHTTLPPDTGYATVETKVNFTRPIQADAGTLRVEGRVVTSGRQIATAEARVLSSYGRVLAHGTSTLMILERRRD